MLYTLQNDRLTVTLSDMGAEITSVLSAEGCEYLWQGDPKYWEGRSPLMFPICGRLIDGKYTYGGKTYQMATTHGFARFSVFKAEQKDAGTVRFSLSANEKTRESYPFEFELTVEYQLQENQLTCTVTVRNPDGETVLPATVGFHPGFNVPLDGDSRFEDWFLEFANACSPDEILMNEKCFLTGIRRAYPLEKGRILPLRHSLFDIDGVFMSNLDRTVTLRSEKSERFVRINFEQLRYLGVWHAPRTDAPYVCIEPWCGLPSFADRVDDFAEKSDMFHIQPKSEQSVSCSITFG